MSMFFLYAMGETVSFFSFSANEFNISANMESESKLVSEWLIRIHPTTTLILRGGERVVAYPHHHIGRKGNNTQCA